MKCVAGVCCVHFSKFACWTRRCSLKFVIMRPVGHTGPVTVYMCAPLYVFRTNYIDRLACWTSRSAQTLPDLRLMLQLDTYFTITGGPLASAYPRGCISLGVNPARPPEKGQVRSNCKCSQVKGVGLGCKGCIHWKVAWFLRSSWQHAQSSLI